MCQHKLSLIRMYAYVCMYMYVCVYLCMYVHVTRSEERPVTICSENFIFQTFKNNFCLFFSIYVRNLPSASASQISYPS